MTTIPTTPIRRRFRRGTLTAELRFVAGSNGQYLVTHQQPDDDFPTVWRLWSVQAARRVWAMTQRRLVANGWMMEGQS